MEVGDVFIGEHESRRVYLRNARGGLRVVIDGGASKIHPIPDAIDLAAKWAAIDVLEAQRRWRKAEVQHHSKTTKDKASNQ